MTKAAEHGPDAIRVREAAPVGMGAFRWGAVPWPGGAAQGERMQTKPRSPESSGSKRQRPLALKKLLKQPVTPQGGESIKPAASQAPLNFTNTTILGFPGASKSFSTHLPSPAVKFPGAVARFTPQKRWGDAPATTHAGVSFAHSRERPARDTDGSGAAPPGHSLSSHLIN